MTDPLFANCYRILRTLGQGSFGTVHLAQDIRLANRQVALKVIHPQLALDPSSLRLFEKEAGFLARLRHDHIVTVYDADIWQEQRFLVMEYIHGPSLAQVVAEQGAQPPERVADWLRQAALALAYAHDQGIVHRDVKSANLLWEKERQDARANGRLYVTDFGLAKAVEMSGGSSSGRSLEVLTGTAAYRAPEVRKTGHTVASDLYSLGVVGYELLAGRRPFQGNDPLDLMMAHAQDPVPPLPKEIPNWLQKVILRLLEKEPEKRPPNAATVQTALTTGPEAPDMRSEPSHTLGKHRPSRAGGFWSRLLAGFRQAEQQPIWQQTGIELVRIPAGSFRYGDKKAKVYLDEFWIARTPVTNAQYKAFVDATGHEPPKHWKNGHIPAGKDHHPVVRVSWDDAVAFCEWAGVRLPSEQEWEKAARGTDGRAYPWGDKKPTPELCNFNRHVGDTTDVRTYPEGASPYGCLDMAGNVWEWCADRYDRDNDWRVVRGGSWYDDADRVRCAFRFRYSPRSYDYGFRVCGVAAPPSPPISEGRVSNPPVR